MTDDRHAPDVTPEAPLTLSHFLGEMTWLLTQSPLHAALPIRDLEWLVMPALLTQQFYVFRDGDRPVGLALWAKTDADGEAKLDRGMLAPENRLTLEQWSSGDRIWLVDLIAPFATAENAHREVMLADLISGPLKGQQFSFHQTGEDGKRVVRQIEADTSDRLANAIREAAGRMPVQG